MISDATYNWEFSTPSGDVILPGHLFESVEMFGDTVVYGKLRDDIDISKYFGVKDPSVIEGRCVAFVPQEGQEEPKKIFSDPVVKVTKDDDSGKTAYSEMVVIEGKFL